MERNAVALVAFNYIEDKENETHRGILYDDRSILCFCCNHWVKPDTYNIVEKDQYCKFVNNTISYSVPVVSFVL